MSLFGRARKMMQGLAPTEPPKPQYYRVTCREGHALRGLRTEGYQALRCPSCGEGVFVLPRSPLPEVPAPATEKPKRSAAVLEPVDEGPIQYSEVTPEVIPPDVEIEWESPEESSAEAADAPPVDSPRPTAAPQPKVKQGSPRARPQPATTPAKPVANVRRREPAVEFQPPGPLVVRPSLVSRLKKRKQFLIPLAVVMLVAGTIGVRLLRQHRQNLPRIAETNRVEGLEALQAGTLDVAKLKLRKAADALEELGDSDAPTVRQSADEASLLAALVGASLQEIVEEVATKPDGPAHFESVHKGRALLIDDEIKEMTNGTPELNYRVFVGTGPKPKVGWLDLTGFTLLGGRKAGDRVTFLARLESVKIGDDGRWAIRFAPDSGVYIRSPEAWKALESLGWSNTVENTGAKP